MIAPHSSRFTLRQTIYWAFSAASLTLAARTSDLSGRDLILALVASACLAAVIYLYTRWLARLESRFRSVHPRKYRMTILLMFYGCSGAAFLMAALSPWLVSWWASPPLGPATGYFIAPALLASAAGFIHSWQDGHTVA